MNFIFGFILAGVIFGIKGESFHSEIKEKISTNFMLAEESCSCSDKETGYKPGDDLEAEHPKKNSPGCKLQVELNSIGCSDNSYCRIVTTIEPLCNENTNPIEDDYKSFDVLGRYKLHLELATWEQAKKICELENAHLVVIDSEAEAAVIKELAALGETYELYSGVNDFKKQGSFVDIFGKPVLKFWDSNEPNNQGNNEHCGTIRKRNGLLNDYSCSAKINFICEKP